MKKRILFIVLFILPVLIYAQHFEISPLFGYQFGGKRYFYQGDLKLKDNANYGGAFGIRIGHTNMIEFQYSFMATHTEWLPDYLYKDEYPRQTYKMDVNTFQLNYIKEFPIANVKPFGLLSFGSTWFDFKENIRDGVFFTVGLGAGCKVMFNKFIGMRIQGRMLMPLRVQGFTFYAGTGGSGISSSAGVVLLEGDFSGGLVFALGAK